MKYGFIKVASAIPAVKVGDVIFNTQQIEEQIALAAGKGCRDHYIPGNSLLRAIPVRISPSADASRII